MCRSRKPVYRQRYRGFESLPLRCKTLAFPGFFAFLANCFGFPARPCTCMLAHAASSSALPCPLVSRQSRLETLAFTRENRWFCSRGGRIRTGSPGTQYSPGVHRGHSTVWRVGWGHSTELPFLVFPGWGRGTMFFAGEHSLPSHPRRRITAKFNAGYAAVT